MIHDDLDRVFGRGRLRMVTGRHVEVFREEARPGERRRYTKRFLATDAGDFRDWTEREWRLLARLVGHGVGCVAEVVRFDRGSASEPAIVQTYDAGITVDHWATLLPVQRDDHWPPTRLRQGPPGMPKESLRDSGDQPSWGGPARADQLPHVLPHVFADCAHWWALARALLGALDAVHELRLVHLDLKPDNVCVPAWPMDFDPRRPGQLLKPRFEALALIDFAFSLVCGDALTTPLPLARQPDYDYQSPRLLAALEASRRGDLGPTRRLDWRCDFYSLAALLQRYLPPRRSPLAADHERSWDVSRLAQARAFVRRLVDVHDAELPARRPHAELVAQVARVLDEPALAASLRCGWTLASDALFARELSPTPITRIAQPVQPAAPAFGPAPVSASTAPMAAAPAPLAARRAWWPLAAGLAAVAVGIPVLGEAWWRLAPSAPAAAGSRPVATPAPLPVAAPTALPVTATASPPITTPAPPPMAANPAAGVAQAQASVPASGPAWAAASAPASTAASGRVLASASASASEPAQRAQSSASAPLAPVPAPPLAQASAPAADTPRTASEPRRIAEARPPATVDNPKTTRPRASAAPAAAKPVAALARPAERRPTPWLSARPAPANRPAPTPVATRPPPILPPPLPGPSPSPSPGPGPAPAPAQAVAMAAPGAAAAPAPVAATARVAAPTPAPASMTPPAPSAAPTAAPTPTPTPATAPVAAPPAIDLDARARTLLAQELPRVAERAERLVLRVLFTAGRADADADTIRHAAGTLRLAPPERLAVVSAAQARALNDAADQAYRRRGADVPSALALMSRAFAANPLDGEIAGDLAALQLRVSPQQAELARQLALHALTTPQAPHPHGRLDDWITLATASALGGRERDARHAWFVALALAPQTERLCRSAVNAAVRHGERVRPSVEAMLQRLQQTGRGERPVLCEWPPHWASAGR